MKKKISYQTRQLKFQTTDTPIDYFKIPVDILTEDNFEVTVNTTVLAPDEMLSVDKHLTSLEHEREETVVLNIQVGKGKTTACYNLIKKYAEDNYKVIVVSPFKKLVDKDYTKVTQMGLNAFHYGQLTGDVEDNFNKYIECDVQVMTINCLLQNPGDDAYSQAFHKKEYLKHLYQKCKSENKKVVIFFDEIHESIHNFNRLYIPNLYSWQDITHKCFVASATFTPASVPVLKYISTLTGGKVNVYETPRVMIANTSHLHIHIVQDAYSGSNIQPLSKIKEIITENEGKRINILTGYKSIAKALVGIPKVDVDIIEAVNALEPNMTVGDGDVPFDNNRNNIGTTFKTGVDIVEDDAILIVVHPYINDSSDYGIFSDGLPSLIQSIARIRGNGHVHIITRMPSVNINKEQSFKCCKDWIFNTDDRPYFSQNDLYNKLYDEYTTKRQEREREIGSLTSLESVCKLKINYSYPSFEDYLIEDSQNLLLNMHYEYGKQLSPYCMWAALNNQFTNTKLIELTHTHRKREYITISKENAITEVSKLISEVALQDAKRLPFYQGVLFLLDRFGEDRDAELKFTYMGKGYSLSGLKTLPSFVQFVANYYVSMVNEASSIAKVDYILGHCLQAAQLDEQKLSDNRLNLYNDLNSLRVSFLEFIKQNAITTSKGELIIDRDIYLKISDGWTKRSINLLWEICRGDKLVNLKVYKLFSEEADVQINDKIKHSVYVEFEKCFTNVTSIKRSYDSKKDQYYLIEGGIERVLPQGLEKINFT